jgi:hypothetical protein
LYVRTLQNLAKQGCYHFDAFGVILYIFSVLFPFINDPGFEETFWSWSLRWFLIIVQAAATLLIMVIKRSDFLVYGFFIIFLASIYNLFVSAVSSNPFPELFSHFLAATVSVYFHDPRHEDRDLYRT